MQKPHLIQRGTLPFNNKKEFTIKQGKKGIDAILNFSYMGSSEYEWGALPESLKAIRESINDYIYFDINMPNDVVITVFCKESEKAEMNDVLTKLSKGECRLKERSDFDSLFNDPKSDFYYKCETDFWWDLDNHYMFWIKHNEFEKEFKVRIK
jgi:hypothetical protein